MLTFSPFYGEGGLMFLSFRGFVHHMFPIMISMMFPMCSFTFIPYALPKVCYTLFPQFQQFPNFLHMLNQILAMLFVQFPFVPLCGCQYLHILSHIPCRKSYSFRFKDAPRVHQVYLGMSKVQKLLCWQCTKC
jgi:hypothetical protein